MEFSWLMGGRNQGRRHVIVLYAKSPRNHLPPKCPLHPPHATLVIFASLLLATAACPVHAQQVNFQFAPSPIPQAEWEVGRKDYEFTGVYSRQSGPGFHFSGGGANLNFREPLNERWAWGARGGFLLMPGRAEVGPFGEVGADYWSLTGGVNFQRHGVKRAVDFTAFGGLDINMSGLNFASAPAEKEGRLLPETIRIVMASMPLGIEAGWSAGSKWRIASYFMATPYFAGSATAKIGGFDVADDTIDPFLTLTAGYDVIFLPWDFSLGAIWQEATSSGNNKQISTFSFQLSYGWSESPKKKR